jgi:hypothetical protein
MRWVPLQGNPALKEDWAKAPDGSVTPEILATQDDRLAYWHTLQEMAGIR